MCRAPVLGIRRSIYSAFRPTITLHKRRMNMITPNAGDRDYIAIAEHGLIGNLRTAALVSLGGSIESYCVPNFDSPSVFARILDKNKGGHFSITPTIPFSTKQNYLPSSNVLQTKFMNEAGVVSVTDFLPRPLHTNPLGPSSRKPLLPWLIRRVECIRGRLPILMQCAPAFNYARDSHITGIVIDDSIAFGPRQRNVLFEFASLTLDLRYVVEATMDTQDLPVVNLETVDLSEKGHQGHAAQALLELTEGQCVTFILRTPPTDFARTKDSSDSEDSSASASPPGKGVTTQRTQERANKTQDEQEASARARLSYSSETRRGAADIAAQRDPYLVSSLPRGRALDDPFLTKELVSSLLHTTNRYWYDWIRRSTYTGSWKEAVHRSALALKLLIYEPTGAVVASPTFSLPEYIGGVRNWDYRASWIRDASFTLYALIRLGFTEEANAYLGFIFERLRNKNADGSLQIMYTIHGGKEFPEEELTHLDGHKGSRPVRIGNGAIDHVQLDIYGELMDCIYLGQKYGKPLAYDDWVLVRELVDYVVDHCKDPDLSIWEVRDMKRHFTYSKIMLWVAIDRGLRLADKRSLPCPNRFKWLQARDELYEDIMNKAWNPEGKFFGQSYEDTDVVDAAVLIMPLVFFMQASDPRFVSTLKQILKSPEKGGLTSNNLVYRYDTRKSQDGVGGEEGTFCLCTLWCIEALTRAGESDRSLLPKAVSMFEDFLLYLNHVGLCTEEISDAGEGLGNAVQGFTHVTLISAAYNLSRTLHRSP
ncbi:glycoside hydrolase family 15 protein [Crucibulum laeve]|uniref:Glycoside hydrolase family 15 protein n=1 Tax=Crucibulum laeve TaxID=68775 RepID=A0A5C3M0H8_9AGAR|nr:glycoside hydrolase family 15 protein [Crucibulum laeve]